MKGQIKAYSEAVNAGVITADDGKKYPFNKGAWGHKGTPSNDVPVVFDVDRGRAVRVIREDT
jgi:hypothetical protein